MISMDRVDSIRKKYRRGEPVAAIARELGVSRDTVYKYARMEDLSPEPPKARRRRPSKMDRWAPPVDQWHPDANGAHIIVRHPCGPNCMSTRIVAVALRPYLI